MPNLLHHTNRAMDDSEPKNYDQTDTDLNVPFQRVFVTGEDSSGVPLDDLEHASKLLIKALAFRQKFMHLSQQSFPALIGTYFSGEESFMKHDDKKTIADHPIHPPSSSENPWQLESPPPKNYVIKSVKGVFHVYKDEV